MSWLLSLLPGGNLTAVLTAAGGILAMLFAALGFARKSGTDAQKAKEAKARDANLDAIKRADAARPVGGVSDDINNRDRRL